MPGQYETVPALFYSFTLLRDTHISAVYEPTFPRSKPLIQRCSALLSLPQWQRVTARGHPYWDHGVPQRRWAALPLAATLLHQLGAELSSRY